MSLQESRYLVSFLTFLAAAIWFGLRAADRFQAGAFDGPEGLAALGRAVLWFIAALVGIGILAQIALAILRGILGADNDDRSDERDRLIEHRAMNAAFTALSLFFLGAMFLLAFGHGAPLAVLTVTAGFVAAGLVADLWRIALHRWGVRF